MSSKGMQIRLDEKLKKQAEQIFKDLGIDSPTAVRIFFTKVVQVGGIPFAMKSDSYYRYSAEDLAELDRRLEEVKDPKNVSGGFETAEELLNDLGLAA